MIFYDFTQITWLGFYTLCSILSRGFYFYFTCFFSFIDFLLPCSFFKKKKKYFQRLGQDPTSFLTFLVFFLFIIFFDVSVFVKKSPYHYVNSSSISISDNEDVLFPVKKYNDVNLYRQYSNFDVSHISFDNLKSVNEDVVAWIVVDGTYINYPVVQTNNNDYYLNHDFHGDLKVSGWIFMDYRNHDEMKDSNTIFYGHNLLNQTAFGSLANLFTEKWFLSPNHKIMLVTPQKKYIYEVFSCYYIEPEVYYLQTNFYDNNQYIDFLNILKNRSIFDFGIDVESNDKIITLSTCTDDNKGRKVVHAKLIS